MVLIGKETLVLVALGTEKKLEFDLLSDAKAKGASVVVFSDTGAETEGARFTCFGKPLTHIAKGIPFIILCQLIAYCKSKETGADPDNPTGLDPWISL